MSTRGLPVSAETRAKRSASLQGKGLGRLCPRLAPTEQATSNDIRWAAGLFEGEGWCGNHYRSTTAQMGQNNTWVLERMKALFGGSIGYYQTRCSHWGLHGARARGFLMSIYGLLSPRRQEQVRKALDIGKVEDA